MASIRIRKRADGTQVTCVLFRENGRQASITYVDHAEALKTKALIDRCGPTEAKRILGVARASNGPTLEKWLSAYVDSLTGAERATRTKYRLHIQRDLGDLGPIPIRDLTRADIAAWVDTLTGSAGTRARKLTFVASALNAAVIADEISKNPAKGVRPPKGLSREPVFLTTAEFRAICEELPEHWRTLAIWLVTTGTRFGEATALRVGDIDPAAGTARVTRTWKDEEPEPGVPKSSRGIRTINLPESTLALLNLSRPRDALLFPAPSGGRVTRQEFYRHWSAARTRAGFTGDRVPRVHDLRHSHASWSINSGTPLFVVSRHLGHSSITITSDVYGHLDRAAAKRAADGIDGMMGEMEG